MLDIRTPIIGDEEKLDAVVKDFKTWINLRQGAELSVFKTPNNRIPYFNEGLVSQIRSSIVKFDRNTPLSKDLYKEHHNVIFQQRVFLRFAQEYDMKNNEIAQEIGVLEKTKQDLFSNLLWDRELSSAENDGTPSFLSDKSSDYMISERLYAWAHMMLMDSEESAFFVTDSPSALDYTIEKTPEHETVFHSDTIPLVHPKPERSDTWADTLRTHLERLASNDWSILKNVNPKATIESVPIEQSVNKTVSLTIYLVPGKKPDELFGRDVGFGVSESSPQKKGKPFKNTLLSLIRF